MAFTDVLTKYLGFLLPEPKHDSFESLFYRNQHLLDCILSSINSENRLVAGTYNSGTGQLEGIRVKFVFGGAVSLVDFPNTAVTTVATPQIWCANRVSGTISAINLAEYAQMVITPDDFPILYTGHHNDTHATTAPFANMIATLNHNTQEQLRLNNPKVNEDVQVVATSSEINKLSGLTSTTNELNQLNGVSVGGTNPGDIVTVGGSIGQLIPVAICHFDINGTITKSVGVSSVSHTASGRYTAYLSVSVPASQMIVFANCAENHRNRTIGIVDWTDNEVSFYIHSVGSGVPMIDSAMYFIVYKIS